MAQRTDDIRHDIENTRAAMTEKLTIVEERVRETAAGVQVSVEKIVEDVGGIVENVKATVDTTLAAVRQGAAGTQASVEEMVKDVGGMVKDVKATVDTTLVAVRQGVAGTQASVEEMVKHVKGTVGETVATVKRTFDLPLQTEQHPWPMVGGAVLVGYMLGRWGGGHPSAAGPTAERATEASRSGSPPASRASSVRPQPQQGIVSGMLDQVKDEMQDEISSLKSVAVGAVMNTLREMFKQAMPALAPHLEQAHTKRGGQASDSPAPQPAARSRAALNGVPS
jgi:hypothetical protein